MSKYIWICLAFLWGSPLSAENIGNVHFDFPLSNYKWNLFFDTALWKDFLGKDFFNDLEDADKNKPPPQAKCFLHREGSSLEVFLALQYTLENDELDDFDLNSFRQAQEESGALLAKFFPNHNWEIWSPLNPPNNGTVLEWELNDKQWELIHGYSRAIKNGNVVTLLCFSTTVMRWEPYRSVWVDMMNNVKVFD